MIDIVTILSSTEEPEIFKYKLVFLTCNKRLWKELYFRCRYRNYFHLFELWIWSVSK